MKEKARVEYTVETAVAGVPVQPQVRKTFSLPIGTHIIGLAVEQKGQDPELLVFFQYPLMEDRRELRTFSTFPVNHKLPPGTIVLTMVGVPGKLHGSFYQMAFVELPASEHIQEEPQNGVIVGNFQPPDTASEEGEEENDGEAEA